jgi:hypothetical protein
LQQVEDIWSVKQCPHYNKVWQRDVNACAGTSKEGEIVVQNSSQEVLTATLSNPPTATLRVRAHPFSFPIPNIYGATETRVPIRASFDIERPLLLTLKLHFALLSFNLGTWMLGPLICIPGRRITSKAYQKRCQKPIKSLSKAYQKPIKSLSKEMSKEMS